MKQALAITDAHKDYCAFLWDYLSKTGNSVCTRDDIEGRALLLANRIHASIGLQSKVAYHDKRSNAPSVVNYTWIKARAEAIVVDTFQFIRYLSILRSTNEHGRDFREPESLFFGDFKMKHYNQPEISPGGGEIAFELAAPNPSDTLEEACVTTALLIAYALECSVDTHYIRGSLDVIEHYSPQLDYSDTAPHPPLW